MSKDAHLSHTSNYIIINPCSVEGIASIYISVGEGETRQNADTRFCERMARAKKEFGFSRVRSSKRYNFLWKHLNCYSFNLF